MASFQLKNFVSIVASMINRMKATQTAITDFNVGAVGRTMLEAPAIELEELYQQAFNMVTAAIPVSVYNSFNFPALPALAASGGVVVTIEAQAQDTLISSGTRFTANSTGAVYTSNADVTIAAGQTSANIAVTATSTGLSSNLAQNSSFSTTPAIAGFVSAVNPSAFVNGRDVELDSDRLIRFNSYISTLARGTPAAIAYGLSTANVQDQFGNITEQVVLQQVFEPWTVDNTQPIGLVKAYIHNGAGSTSATLLANAKNITAGYVDTNGIAVPGYKSAGVVCDVLVATEQPLNVSATIKIDPTAVWSTVQAAAMSAVNTYLLGLGINQSANFSKIVSLLEAVDGILDVTVTAPVANVAAAVGVKIMPGVLTFTQAS